MVFQSTRCARTYRPGLVHLKLVRDTVACESDLTKGSELSCFALLVQLFMYALSAAIS